MISYVEMVRYNSIPYCNSSATVSCPNLEDPEHGTVTTVNYLHVNSATYSCDSGYELDGWWSRKCDISTGTWKGEAPTCQECKAFA